MTRFILFLFIFLGLPVILAAAPRTMPPPKELASLAEQLAPLIKNNPALPELTLSKKSKAEQLSPVEDAFSQRAGTRLTLFGYSQIGRHLSQAPTTGQVQDDVILGTGDRIMVTFRGQRDDSKTYRITPQGELIVDGLDPITASGITVGALRHTLENATAKNLLNSTVFVSIKSLRQISITVMGEVKMPGVYTLSPFQTVLDAIALSRGITKNGSLRNVKLLRGGKSITLDFYQLLLQGDLGAPIQLRDGDKIMIPVLGKTVAVAGDVKRPGIFELSTDEKASLLFSDILQLAGGVIRPGANQFVKLSLTQFGDEKVSDIFAKDTVTFDDGDMVMVTGGTPMRTNGIIVAGHVRQPGPRSVSQTPNLKTLLNNPRVFREGIYPLIGIIERMDPKTFSTRLIDFSPSAVMQGTENKKLFERDRIIFFSAADIRNILNAQSKKEFKKNQKEQDKIFIRSLKLSDSRTSAKPKTNPLFTRQITDFLMDRLVTVNGAVLQPGYYPVSGNVTLNDLLNVAGGISPDAEKTHVEILHANMLRKTVNINQKITKDMLVSAKDKIIIPTEYTVAEKNGIEIIGEVSRPGKYDLRKGDTLLDLIDRAGGTTNLAFPAGTIFMRESERYKQEEQFRNAARSLDLAIAGYYLKKDSATEHTAEIRNAQKVADELRRVKALGRITVQADPEILRDHPEYAMLLQPGDRIYIPRRAPTLAVAGEVMSPVVLQYDPNLSGDDYIRMAGGTTKFADTGRNFIVFPDGSAQPIGGMGNWFGGKTILAGSTIIVPRDPDPLDFLKVTESIGNIMSQLAITAVATAQLQRPYY